MSIVRGGAPLRLGAPGGAPGALHLRPLIDFDDGLPYFAPEKMGRQPTAAPVESRLGAFWGLQECFQVADDQFQIRVGYLSDIAAIQRCGQDLADRHDAM